MAKRVKSIEEQIEDVEWVNLDDLDNQIQEYTYRLTFICDSEDFETIVNEVTAYGNLLKRERGDKIR